MKTLKFESKFVKEILSARKTSTWRLFDDKDLKKDDELILVNSDTGDKFAKAVATSVEEIELGSVKDENIRNHGYENKEQMFESYKKYYGLRVTPKSILKVVEFRLINE